MTLLKEAHSKQEAYSLNPEKLLDKFLLVRSKTEAICEKLKKEDYKIQPALFVSPPKWHLGHSTWFFEQFVLSAYSAGYQVFDKDFSFLFNSYYNNVGTRVLRPNRGNMTRPAVDEIYAYRKYVSDTMVHFISQCNEQAILLIIELGINHEEQHQELLAYDIKYILGTQALFPQYSNNFQLKAEDYQQKWIGVEAGIYEIGADKLSFCFDNELNRHKVHLNNFQLSNKLVTNAEYLEFIEDGGYKNFNLWHADGWDFIQENSIIAPLYWHHYGNQWQGYHFDGLKPIELNLPVMNISLYEAYAFAEWKNCRLATEAEWEAASDKFNWGQLWEWTGSAYLPYPGFNKAAGALGEYNGKFMINQMVLRGASIATAPNHSRKTYRNFFHAENRWQFSGIRLAK